jgi:uncharacterized protein YacL
MTEDYNASGQIGRIALIVGTLLVAVFGVGMTAGIIAVNLKRGTAISPTSLALVAAAALLAALAAYVAYRTSRAMTAAAGAPTSRERRNRVVLVVCGAIGGIMGMVLSLAGTTPMGAFSNEPIAPWLAAALAFAIGVLMPVLCVYWHRSVADEQEAAAYNKGALIGLYVYLLGAPTWWLLWRGGLLPEPNGIIIYMITIGVTGVIWLWAKYR